MFVILLRSFASLDSRAMSYRVRDFVAELCFAGQSSGVPAWFVILLRSFASLDSRAMSCRVRDFVAKLCSAGERGRLHPSTPKPGALGTALFYRVRG